MNKEDRDDDKKVSKEVREILETDTPTDDYTPEDDILFPMPNRHNPTEPPLPD